MNIAQSVRNLFAAPQKQVGSSFDAVISQMTRYGQFRQMETVDTDAAYKLAIASAWVYSDIKLIADRASSRDANVKILNQQDKTVLENHPFAALLNRPNPFMAGAFLKRYTAWWYLLRGNAYIFISTPMPGKGAPTELWPLAANMVRPLPERIRQGQGVFRDEQVIDYEYNVNGSLEILPGENIIHFRMPNPFDWWEGMSPLTAALLAVQSDHTQARWTRDFFAEDNAIPSAIISVPSTTSPQDFDRQRATIAQQLRDGQKRIFTRSGDLTVETITQTLEQMQIIDSRKFSRDEIDRVYGIPEGLISGGLSGDSRLAAEIAFARNTIQPLIDYFAEQLTADVAPYYGNIVFEAPNVVPQDRALEIQEYTIYGQDRSIAENRQERGLEPVQLPPEIAELTKIPVRLLAYVTQSVPETPQVGDMIESQSPANMVDEQAGKAIALETELKRWRKVALGEWRAGRKPAERAFDSAVIEPLQKASILAALAVADNESEVKAAFEAAPFRVSWQDYP